MTPAKRKFRILLVDGDSTVQHLRALMLRMRGYNVDTAVDLGAARTIISAGPQYDLVIVDVGYFADPGLEFCEEIKQRHPNQKLLMQVDGHIYLVTRPVQTRWCQSRKVLTILSKKWSDCCLLPSRPALPPNAIR